MVVECLRDAFPRAPSVAKCRDGFLHFDPVQKAGCGLEAAINAIPTFRYEALQALLFAAHHRRVLPTLRPLAS